MVQVLAYPITKAKWQDHGGGVQQELISQSEDDLNIALINLETAGYKVKEIKVNHFTAFKHNNGGYDEVWVQYTIVYEEV